MDKYKMEKYVHKMDSLKSNQMDKKHHQYWGLSPREINKIDNILDDIKNNLQPKIIEINDFVNQNENNNDKQVKKFIKESKKHDESFKKMLQNYNCVKKYHKNNSINSFLVLYDDYLNCIKLLTNDHVNVSFEFEKSDSIYQKFTDLKKILKEKEEKEEE